MKRLLLGITLLVIIFVAVLCKPIENIEEEILKPKQEASLDATITQNNKK